MRRPPREWWLLVCFVMLAQLNATLSTCPPSDVILPCRCSTISDDAQIWCSYSTLPNVISALQRLSTNLQSTVDEMILEGNNLPSLPGRNFEGLKITRLMLRDNGLERVTSSWLATQEPTLQELYIVEPRMRTLPPDILDNLRRLEAVTLQAGLMKRTPRFSGLPKLRYIQIQSPVLMELSPESLQSLPSLEQIHVIGSPHLTKLDGGLLMNLPKLNLINISNCSVSWLHPKTFINLPGVRELSLTWNRLSDAGVISRACRDLNSLQLLRLDNNFIDRLIEGSFVDLPALRELYLSGNMISEIHAGAFRNTPSLKILDLNKNLLRRVNAGAFLYPSGSSLEELWLIDNHLHRVNELKTLFNSLIRLRFIDMSKNQIEELPFDVLRGHPTLERLHLNENRIKRLPKKGFSGMTSLRELRLRNNSISEFPDGATWNLPSLKGLDLSQNKLRRLDARLMTFLPLLRTLDLSENYIDTVLPDAFVGNLDLETINLSKNFVTSFHALTFSHLPRLYELDVSWNRLREVIPGLPRDIEYLRMGQNQIFTIPAPPSGLDLPHLRLLDLSGNALQVLQQDTFSTMSRLERLFLNDNLLQSLEKGCLNGLSRLEVLNVRNNRLRDINSEYLKGLKGLKEINLQGNLLEAINSGILAYSPKLEAVRLGNNKITEIQQGAFSNARELQELNLTHNQLDRFPEALQGLKMLRNLDISHNQVRSVQPFLFESLPSLTELRIGNNKLFDLSSNTFSDLQKLEFLDLSNNEVENIANRAIASLPSLIALQMGGNRLTTISGETFVDLPELQSVDLQSNHLQQISERAFINVPHLSLLNLSHNLLLDVEKAGVKQLRSLEVLDLSDNKVAQLEGRTFAGMDWLVELKLDNNIICNINGQPFNDLPRLRVLSLRHNRMTTVTESAFQQMRNNIALLDIDGNPLSCSCRMLWLQSWLQETSTVGPRCRDGTLFRDARLSRNDCAHSRIVEPVVPGCEERSHHGPALESLHVNQLTNNSLHVSHVLQPPHTHQPLINTGLKGPDQESEYVYDEYMEYEEVNGTELPPTLIPVEVTAGEMKASPHIVTGNTPTLYAAQPPPKLNLSNPGLGYDDLKKVQSSTTSPQLTFFGIPLPSLSIGNIWRGRSTETSPFSKGKIQPVHPAGRNREHNFVTRPPPEESTTVREVYPPYQPPSSLEGGFRPLIASAPRDPLPETLPNLVKEPPVGSQYPTKDFVLPTLDSGNPALRAEIESTTLNDKIPSAALPVEHRAIDDTPSHWNNPKPVNPGRIEPITLDKKLEEPKIEETYDESNYDIPPSSVPSTSGPSGPSDDVNSLNINEPNFSTRSIYVSEDNQDNSIVQQDEAKNEEDPISNKFTNYRNDWYFENYNKTNLQPFVERTITTTSNGLSLTPSLIYCSAIFVSHWIAS